MKRIFSILMLALMLCTLSMTVFAAGGNFVQSPSANLAPLLVTAVNKNTDCTASVRICAYVDRHILDSKSRATLEAAYASIAFTQDLSEACDDVVALADSMQVDVKSFAASDLFDIYFYNCSAHAEHGGFTITIKPQSVENYVGMMHYVDGAWELVASTVNEQGEITFEVDSLSPFAILVHDGDANAQNLSWLWILLVILVVAGVTVGAVARAKAKKRKNA